MLVLQFSFAGTFKITNGTQEKEACFSDINFVFFIVRIEIRNAFLPQSRYLQIHISPCGNT